MSAHDDELDILRAGVSCATLLEKISRGWILDRQESTRRALKFRRNSEILIINHDGRGWWDPQSDNKGDVFSLAQHLDRSLNFGQVRKLLRGCVGIAPVLPTFRPARRENRTGKTPEEQWSARPALNRDSPTWRYLAHERCLPHAVLVKAAATNVVREGPNASAWFAHRNHNGFMTGIEMRGLSFRGFRA